MANFPTCMDFLWSNEDAQRACSIVHDPTKDYPAAQACSGINSAFYPTQFSAIAALPQSQRAPAVEEFYQKEFWNKWFQQLASDDVAMRVFDMAVNGGPGTAVKLLQQAVNSFHAGNPLTVDGGWGPNTVAAVNAINPQTLVSAFQQARCAYYEKIGGPNLPAWLARAKK
jgi:lysozyme family protein